MLKLEVLIIDKNTIRVTLVSRYSGRKGEHYCVIEKHEIIDSVRELIEHIPNEYARQGSSNELLEKLQIKGQALFQHLFGEVGNQLRNLTSRKSNYLTIVIDEEISFIPFELLFMGDVFMWQKFIISRKIQQSTTRNLLLSNHKYNHQITFVGDPSEDDKLADTIQDELYSVSESLPSTIEYNGPLFGRDYKKLQVSELISSSKIFHFSGHYEGNKKGWKLFDNCYYDVNDINGLQSVPQFIFSNTCGSITGISKDGFINRFLQRGVQGILSTVGKVPSKEAKDFSIYFYNYLILGNSIGKSINRARKDLINQYGIQNLAWMYYIYFGDAKLRLFKSRISLKYWITKTKRTIFWSIVAIGLGLIIPQLIEDIHVEEYAITLIPSEMQFIKDGDVLKPGQNIIKFKANEIVTFTHSKYDNLEVKLEKIDDLWLLSPIKRYEEVYIGSQPLKHFSNHDKMYEIIMIPKENHNLEFISSNDKTIKIYFEPDYDEEKEGLHLMFSFPNNKEIRYQLLSKDKPINSGDTVIMEQDTLIKIK
jgi:hypothetical protein